MRNSGEIITFPTAILRQTKKEEGRFAFVAKQVAKQKGNPL